MPSDGLEDDFILAPYLRFRGLVFSCKRFNVQHRVIDTSILATQHSFLPRSLGVRPQALKLRILPSQTQMQFLNQHLSIEDIFKHTGSQTVSLAAPTQNLSLFHRAFVGETVSVIYAPYFCKNNILHDAIVQRPVQRLDCGRIRETMTFDHYNGWQIKFIPTLCPHCGWDLQGERQSCVLFCTNCNSAWQAVQKGFERLSYGVVATGQKDVFYVPFWRMKVSVEGLQLQSYADLIRLANLPKVIHSDWENREVFFWCPAFKVQPNLFLCLAKQLTISQPEETSEEGLNGLSLYPVTLPATEALESVVVTIAHIATDKKRIYPLLQDLKATLQNYRLIYLPFTVRPSELVQNQMNFSINRNALKIGKKI
jgi:hypothetical protein